MVLVSFGFKKDARLVPLLIGIPTLVLAITALISEKYPRLATLFNISLEDITGVTETGAVPSEKDVGKKVLAISVWMVDLFILIFLVGFVIATPVFMFLFFRISVRAGWLKTLVIAIVMGGIIYGGFEILMKGNMFEGILFDAILPPL
jgi:hypothetical protein